MRRLRSRESSSFNSAGDGGSWGEQADGGDASAPDWDAVAAVGNRRNLIGDDVSGVEGAALRMERKVQGLVGKLKSSMKGLGLPTRSGSVKSRPSDIDDPEVHAHTAAIFGSQPTAMDGRHAESLGTVQQGKVGFKMNRFSLPVFASAVGAELRGYGVMEGDGAVAFEHVPASDAAQDPDDPWSSTRPQQQQQQHGSTATAAWPSEDIFGGAPQAPDPWALSSLSSAATVASPADPWAITAPSSVQPASREPRPGSDAPDLQQRAWGYGALDPSPSGSRSRESSSQPRGFSLQIGSSGNSSSRESSLSPMPAAGGGGSVAVPFHASGKSRPTAPSFAQSEVASTMMADSSAGGGGSSSYDDGSWTEQQGADDGEALPAASGSSDGGVRIGKLKLPSIRRMAEAAVDVLRGPTDGMEAQLPVGGRDPSAAPFAHEPGIRQDVRTMLRERLQRGFRRSSSASAGLATMAGSRSDFWSSGAGGRSSNSGGSGQLTDSASSYGHLPSASIATAGGGHDD